MIGLAILAIGAVLVWAAFTGKAENVWTALQTDLAPPGTTTPATTSTTSGGGGGGTSFNPASSAAYLPGPGGLGGTFQGASGAQYSGSYASLTPAQRDDVNAYANNSSSA
jgi:hypothetical protein